MAEPEQHATVGAPTLSRWSPGACLRSRCCSNKGFQDQTGRLPGATITCFSQEDRPVGFALYTPTGPLFTQLDGSSLTAPLARPATEERLGVAIYGNVDT